LTIFINILIKTNSFLDKMPKILQEKILKQEKNLENIKHESSERVKTAKYLQRITHKNKDELLFNKNEINRMKNEIKDISEFTSQTLGYNPTNNW